MKKPYIFESLSSDALKGILEKNGARFDLPILMAFDCDDTIIDRSKSSHAIENSIRELFEQLRQHPKIKIAINTGRDALSYQPVEQQIGDVDACLFVAGRALRTGLKTEILPDAKLSRSVCEQIWRLVHEQMIPFVEVRTDATSFFLSNRIDGIEQYMGHDRPLDWFEPMGRFINYCDEKSAHKLIVNDQIIRIDIALFSDQYPKLFRAIETGSLNLARNELEALLPEVKNLTFSPIPMLSGRHLGPSKIGAICLFSESKQTNKGKGLQIVAKRLNVPDGNIFSFGDSSSSDASDLAVADFLPMSHLLIASNGDAKAKDRSDFIIDSIGKLGVVRAAQSIMKFWS